MLLDDKIKVFASDDNLKALGELLSNDTSRKIISHLMKNEMYTNELSTKLDIRVSLVIHHLKKMESLGLLEITHKKIIKKGEKHRFFKMNTNIFVTLNNTKEEVKEKGILKKIFRDGLKFYIIGIITLSVFVITDMKNYYNPNDISYASIMPELIAPLTVLSIGLIIERVLSRKKRKN